MFPDPQSLRIHGGIPKFQFLPAGSVELIKARPLEADSQKVCIAYTNVTVCRYTTFRSRSAAIAAAS
jgi:hypothetical protein